MRQELKQVMGGLQTLLRNHHQAFLVTKNAITLRFDANRLVHSTREGEKTREPAAHAGELFKTKRCWMETNHPDGCPYPPEICNFAHSFENLRLPPTDFMSKKTRRK
ncbi:tRNA methyltransferase 44 [Sparganum proliferum]